MNDGMRVLMVSAFYRDNEPGGIATGIEFRDGADGVEYCRRLAENMPLGDVAPVAGTLGFLAALSPRRHELSPVEAHAVICAINWLQCRRHLVADEYNGTMFVVEFDGALIQCERNPVTIDLAKECTGENAVDVTDILHAARGTLDGGEAAVRAAADHVRGRR